MTNKPKARIYVEAPLKEDAAVLLNEAQAGYVLRTLRMKEGQHLALFNGKDGEWEAEIAEAGKRHAGLLVRKQRTKQKNSPDIELVFAPVKNEKIDYTVKRAAELGVNALRPVLTRRTVVARVNMERLRANAIEAAQQ
jgi:16S rRNA (uracil1498-N3)-methyltransferase